MAGKVHDTIFPAALTLFKITFKCGFADQPYTDWSSAKAQKHTSIADAENAYCPA